MFRRRQQKTIDVAQAYSGLAAGRLALIDVRERSERALGFAPGSLHVPLRELKAHLANLPADRPLAFVCQTGRRSGIAATVARGAGLDAHNVDGGMTAWEREGFAIERSDR